MYQFLTAFWYLKLCVMKHNSGARNHWDKEPLGQGTVFHDTGTPDSYRLDVGNLIPIFTWQPNSHITRLGYSQGDSNSRHSNLIPIFTWQPNSHITRLGYSQGDSNSRHTSKRDHSHAIIQHSTFTLGNLIP